MIQKIKVWVLFSMISFGFFMVLGGCASQRQVLPEQTELAASVKWYASSDPNGSSGVTFVLSGIRVWVDPVLKEASLASAPKADLILITHSHKDHYSLESIKAVSKVGTEIIMPTTMKELPGSTALVPGFSVDIGNLTVSGYPAFNETHSKISKWLAFTVTDGVQSVFISGDTDVNKDLLGIKNIDLAFFFMYPPYTMPLKDSILLAKSMRPAVIVPVHWLLGMEDILVEFTEKVGSRSSVLIFEQTE